MAYLKFNHYKNLLNLTPESYQAERDLAKREAREFRNFLIYSLAFVATLINFNIAVKEQYIWKKDDEITALE